MAISSSRFGKQSLDLHNFSISKRVTGTQSLSTKAKLMVGKRHTQASRIKVPAHVGWTRESPVSAQMGTKRTVVFS